MENLDKYPIPEKVALYTKFENLLWECTEESVEKAKEMIKYFESKIMYKLIFTIAVYRPFSFKLLGDFTANLGQTTMKFPCFYLFSKYLLSRNLLTTQNFKRGLSVSHFNLDDVLPTEQYEHPLNLSENPIAFYAYQNDVKKLSEQQALNDVDLNRVFFDVQNIAFSLIDLTVFCGSLDVLKYLILNNVSFTPDTPRYAVKGGKETIIEFLVEQGLSFDNQLENAIMAHQNKIAYWLIDNYNNKEVDLPSCIGYFNTDILLYFVYTAKRSFTEKDYYKKKMLLYAKEHNNDILLDYFEYQYH